MTHTIIVANQAFEWGHNPAKDSTLILNSRMDTVAEIPHLATEETVEAAILGYLRGRTAGYNQGKADAREEVRKAIGLS